MNNVEDVIAGLRKLQEWPGYLNAGERRVTFDEAIALIQSQAAQLHEYQKTGCEWTDDDLRDWWRQQGGNFHGPNVETGTMPESALLPTIRRLLDYAHGISEINSDWSSERDARKAAEQELALRDARIAELEKDAGRLDWLESQCEACGCEVHEGNRWIVDGPFNTVRDAIDEAISAK